MSLLTKYYQNIFQKSFDEKTIEETREIQFVISTGERDRHKDVLNMDNWSLDSFNANPIIGYQHNVYGDNMCNPANPDDVIGKGSAWIDSFQGKRVLVSKAKFETADLNPTAEKVFRKILFGSLNAASVGILPIGKSRTEYQKDGSGNVVDKTNYWEGQELLEWSVVNIPANAGARRRSMKNHTAAALTFVQTLLDDKSIKDIRQMRVQEILDAIDKRYVDAPLSILESELTGPDPNLTKYQTLLKTIKNNG